MDTLQQGSPEWLEWRRQGIGASESAALLHLCPYKTPHSLWVEKTNKLPSETSALFRRGHETEALVRAELELETGEEYGPACFEHPEYPFIRASLDGWNEQTRQGVEIKMVGQEAFTQPIPPHHQVQMQHQMLVTATDRWTYIKHCQGQTARAEIKADKTMQRDILAACWAFWSKVQANEAPPFTDRDWVPSQDANLDLALRHMMEQTSTRERNEARAEVMRLVKHKRTVNTVPGPALGAKVSTDPARVTLPKGATSDNAA